MKEDRTLRKSLLMLTIVFLVVPLTALSLLMQLRIWDIFRDNMQVNMQENLQSANQTFNMVMDKYDTVLYDFCTDDGVIEMVERINRNEDALDISSNQLRRALSHICNRNSGIEAITLVTSSGRTFFYDRNAASFVATTWADSVKVPVVEKGAVYQSGSSIPDDKDGHIHLIQVARRFVDYQNIHRAIGTVIISINQDVLWDHMSARADSQFYLCEDDTVIAAKDIKQINYNVKDISRKNKQVLSMENEESGWTIYDFYSTREYNQAMTSRMAMDLFSTILSILFVLVLLFFASGPIMQQVNQLVNAMEKVERGDFSVKVEKIPNLPREITHIVDGFNTMVQRIGVLMTQVKTSMVEQKNAELSAMEAQIDPHFLYNTLDTINWKAIENEEYEISSMVGALADILRYSIRNPGETVSMGQEIYWLSQYTMLQKEKLTQPLELITDVPEELGKYRIHKLILQPFIENAIKHAFYQQTATCRLEVGMRLSGHQIHITIKDNGRGIPEDMLKQLNDDQSELKGHVGITNVRRRLKLYYGDAAAIYFESRQGMGTTVHLFVEAICGEEEKNADHNS